MVSVDMLNSHPFYRSKYIETKEEDWAVKSENGTWFGMIGMVARREVDAAVGGLTMYPSRLNLVDFLIPLMVEKYAQIQTSILIKTRFFLEAREEGECGNLLELAVFLSRRTIRNPQ
jgi:hypothetical protein